jgi:tetratricopeptide (TPR) repeat protein
MSILDRILGRTPAGGPQISARRLPPLSDLPVGHSSPLPLTAPVKERPISVYDQYGRKIEVGREAWRKDMLLPNLARNRDNPDTLHGLISDALRDDFAADVLEYARHLADTDPQPRRGAVLLGAVLLGLKDFAGARDVLERAIGRHGEDAYLLSNLARALAELGDAERADELIWRALALDPNDEAALGWIVARAGDSGGPVAVLASYARAAMLPGSWRAHLALARAALGRGDAAEAARLYEESLQRAVPPPTSLLEQLTGDLDSRGESELLVRLTRPHFDAAVHGLIVGGNLLRALLDLGRLTEARKLLEQLHAQQRPDWREQLLAWDRKVDDAHRQYAAVTAPSDFIIMHLDQPVWSNGVLGFDAVLPRKATSAPRIHIVCASGVGPPSSAGQLGCATRALPMFLAEEIYLRCSAKSSFLLPWMTQGGFILSAQPWSRELLPSDPSPPDLLVFTHIDAVQSPWHARVTLVQPHRPQTPSITFTHKIVPGNLAQGSVALLEDILARATLLLSVHREDEDPALATPDGSQLPAYFTALEQALAVGLAVSQETGESFQVDERTTFDNLFDVAANGAALLRPRMLLLNALENQSRRRPDIVREHIDEVLRLQARCRSAPGSAPGSDHGKGARLLEQAVATLTDKVRAAR